MMSLSNEGSSAALHIAQASKLQDQFRIVSTQSTARPGAIIELEAIEDATQDWQNTTLLHAFQEQLILAHGNLPSQRCFRMRSKNHEGKGLIPTSMSAMVDLQSLGGGSFCEPFYVLLVEKKSDKGSFNFDMHMWKVSLCLEGSNAPDNNDDSSGTVTPDQNENGKTNENITSEIHVNTKKVCCQKLPLPADVEIVDCVAAAGHLSSSSIFPACLAPYLIITACTDNTVRLPAYQINEAPMGLNNHTYVKIDLHRVSILEIDEQKNKLSLHISQALQWPEPRIRANFSTVLDDRPSIKLSPEDFLKIWHPDLDMDTNNLLKWKSLYEPRLFKHIVISGQENGNSDFLLLRGWKEWRASLRRIPRP